MISLDVILQREAQQLAELEQGVAGAATPPHAVSTLPGGASRRSIRWEEDPGLALDSLDVNAAQHISRQVLGRVPGLDVYGVKVALFPSDGGWIPRPQPD